MPTAQQHERKAHRFVDGDGTKVDVVALGVLCDDVHLVTLPSYRPVSVGLAR